MEHGLSGFEETGVLQRYVLQITLFPDRNVFNRVSYSSKVMPGAILIGGGMKQAITLLYRDISNVNAVSKEPIKFTMNFDTYLETIMYFSCAEIVHEM